MLSKDQVKQVKTTAEAIHDAHGSDEMILMGAITFLAANFIARMAKDEDSVIEGVEALMKDMMKNARAHWAYYQEKTTHGKPTIRQH